MEILRVIGTMNPDAGGPVEAIHQMDQPLRELGCNTDVVTLDPPGAPWLADVPMRTHPMGPIHTSYGYTGRLVPWLRENASRYDAVVAEGIWDYSLMGTWLALRRTGQPYHVYAHGMLDPWFKRAYPLKHLKKSLFWHGALYYALRDARAVLFTCEEERLLARQSFARYRCREAIASYPTSGPPGGAPAQRAAFLGRFPHLRGKRLILFLGRLHPKKGCDLLLDAFAHAAAAPGADPALHLVMAGPDQVGWQAALQRRARALGVEGRVTWAGMLTGDLKWGAFRAAEAFALPSHQENFGIAVVEALACGVPALVSERVNIWREVAGAGAGLAAPDTAAGARALLGGWLGLDGGARGAMARAARRCFQEKFEIGSAAVTLTQVLGLLPPRFGERVPAEVRPLVAGQGVSIGS